MGMKWKPAYRKVLGVGINDAEYVVTFQSKVDGHTKQIGMCPYYKKWRQMLHRCYNTTYLKKFPSYEGCFIQSDWIYFSNFISWVDSQPNKDWQNCELDKDLLVDGNKCYGSGTVVFVNKQVNYFLTDRKIKRGNHPLGVSRDYKKFRAQCHNPFTTIQEYLGVFDTELEAHKAWQAKKHEYACQLADLQEDPRVAEALRQRYAPDKDWTNR